MGKQVLRPYQEQGLAAWRASAARATVLVLPTGAGKTSIASSAIQEHVNGGGRAIFLAHRNELIFQAAQRLRQYDVDSEVVKGPEDGIDWSQPVLTGTVQTLIKRLPQLMDWARGHDVLVISDETHRVLGPTQRTVVSTIEGAARTFRLVGLTATPYRLDGQGLGVEYGGVFDALIEVVQPTFLFDNGQCSNCRREKPRGDICCGSPVRSYLMRPRLFPGEAVDTSGIRKVAGDYDKGEIERRSSSVKLVGNLVEQYKKLVDGRVGVIFAVGIKHTHAIAEAFNSTFVSGPGFTGKVELCGVVTGAENAQERNHILSRLAIGQLRLVANCGVLLEGWDPESDYERVLQDRLLWDWNASKTQRVQPKYVPLTVAIDACPTHSMGKFMQGPIGRNTRNHPDKDQAFYLGHADNLDRHCHPDQHHGFDLSGYVQKKDQGATAPKLSPDVIVVCRSCFSTFPGGTARCNNCGSDLAKGKKIETVQGDLKEVAPKIGEGMTAGQRTVAAKEKAYREWVADARRGNRDPYGADSRYKDHFGEWPDRGLKERVYREYGFGRYLTGYSR